MNIKIEILNNGSMRDNSIFDVTNKRYVTHRGMFPKDWLEDIIENVLLSRKQFNDYNNGSYQFIVSDNKLALIDSYYVKARHYNKTSWLKEQLNAQTMYHNFLRS